MDLEGKIAMVTGAGGGGCGRAIARRLAQEGATRWPLIEAIGRGAADVSKEDEVRARFAFAESSFGGLDILLNQCFRRRRRGLLDGWFEALRLDLLGVLQATRLAIDFMRRRGGGAIVNVGSTSALPHGGGHSPWPGYDVAKMGIMRLTTALRIRSQRQT